MGYTLDDCCGRTIDPVEEPHRPDCSVTLEASIESKVVVMREGSALRTAEEMCEILILDARSLVDRTKVSDAKYIVILDELFPEESDEDYYQILGELADDHEMILADQGYQVFHNDGFVIYKDLTEAESDYLGGF